MIKSKSKRKKGSVYTFYFAETLTELFNLEKFFKNLDSANKILNSFSSKKR